MHLDLRVSTAISVVLFFLVMSILSNMSAKQRQSNKYHPSFHRKIRGVLHQCLEERAAAGQDTDMMTRLLHLNQASSKLATLRFLLPDQDLEKIGTFDPHELNVTLTGEHGQAVHALTQWAANAQAQSYQTQPQPIRM